MVPEDFCQNNQYLITFTTDENISKFEVFTNNKLDTLYPTESTRIEWLQTLYEYWDKGDTLFSSASSFWAQFLFQYNN